MYKIKSNKNDEWLTPKYAVEPILEFLKPNSIIWCPFDKEDSNFVKVFKENGHKVINTHINEKNRYYDFFKSSRNTKNVKSHKEWEIGDGIYIKSGFNADLIIEKVDYIISNPPFSIRKQIFNHLENLDLPFAMLIPLVSIALKPIREKLQDKQILIFDKRIKFISPEGIECKNPPSETAYICKNLLPNQIIFRKLTK